MADIALCEERFVLPILSASYHEGRGSPMSTSLKTGISVFWELLFMVVLDFQLPFYLDAFLAKVASAGISLSRLARYAS